MEDENKINLEKDDEKIETKKTDKRRKAVFVCLTMSCILNVYLMYIVLHSLNFAPNGVSVKDAQKLNFLKTVMTEYYYKEIKKEDLIESCINGMTKLMDDPYSKYLKEDDMEILKQTTEGNYKGIGVAVKMDEDNVLEIIEVFDNSPAQKSGIKVGDKVLSVDGKDIIGEKADQLFVNLLKNKDKEVDIRILRPSTDERINFRLKANNIKLENVESKILDNNIGYIKLKMFDNEVSNSFKEHLNKLRNQNIKALLLDVRDNPGGDYNEVIAIADLLLPKGSLIVYTEDKYKKQIKEFAKNDGLDLPMGVLINKSSASASEVLSGALQDNDRAWLLGEKTYGKGLVQTVIDFKDGTGLKLTTAEYFTPLGKCVQGEGIEPNYKVELPEEYKDSLVSLLSEDEDIQLKEAISIIKKEIK